MEYSKLLAASSAAFCIPATLGSRSRKNTYLGPLARAVASASLQRISQVIRSRQITPPGARKVPTLSLHHRRLLLTGVSLSCRPAHKRFPRFRPAPVSGSLRHAWTNRTSRSDPQPTPDSLTFRSEAYPVTRTLAMSDLSAIEIQTSSGHPFGRYALIGAAVGGTAGAILGYASHKDCNGCFWRRLRARTPRLWDCSWPAPDR